MGFFKENKNDSFKVHDKNYEYNDLAENKEVTGNHNTDFSEEDGGMMSENENVSSDIDKVLNGMNTYEAEDELASDDLADETAVITSGLTVTGNLDSTGSIDIYGKVEGDVSCMGKLTASGVIYGNVGANEVFANDAQIEGTVRATGSVKIGKGTVIIGDLSGTSAVIAGAVKGNIDIEGPVIVDSTAIIVGDIKSKTVQINNGATIEGRCSQCYGDVNTEAVFDIGRSKKKDEKGNPAAKSETKEKNTDN